MKELFKLFSQATMYEDDDALFRDMEATTEGSMHHREANVLVHTAMVLGEYYNLTPDVWELRHLEGAFACLFHDVGKPAAEVDKFSEERGNYHSYPGHEIISARAWENWIVDNFQLVNCLFSEFSIHSIYNVGWMVEHHLPYNVTNKYKLECIYKTGRSIGGTTFTDVLTADGRGRINDNAEAQALRMSSWLDAYNAYIPTSTIPTSGKSVHVLIGPSGSSKSTLVSALQDVHGPLVSVFSLDALRLEWYSKSKFNDDPSAQYEFCHQMADADEVFTQRWQKEYSRMVKDPDTYILVVDGTNLTAKNRRFFVDMAKRHKYSTHGIYVTSSLRMLAEHQSSRTDKHITDEVIKRHYAMVQYPSYNEFDAIHIL